MIYRIALYRYKEGTDISRIEEMERLRAELSRALEGEHGVALRGTSTSRERLGPGGARTVAEVARFTHGWIVEAGDEAALQCYIDHPIHLEMISKMDCLDDVVVEDLEFET